MRLAAVYIARLTHDGCHLQKGNLCLWEIFNAVKTRTPMLLCA